MDRWKPTNEDKENYLKQIQEMSNNDVLEEVYSVIGGDCEDGCYSPMGEFQDVAARKELYKRLKEIGFFE